MKIGVLIPKSTTHPLIGHDFFDGLKCNLRQMKGHEVSFGNIGFGTSKELVYTEAEKLLLEKQVEVLVAFADFPVVEALFSISESLNKLLIVVNTGGKIQSNWKAPDSVLFLNLNEWLNSFISGKLAAQSSKTAVFSSSFYDAGYAIGQSVVDGFIEKGGAIEFNFIGKHEVEEFDLTPLINYLNETSKVNQILTVLSGKLVNEFLAQIKEKADREITLWVNQAFLFELNNSISEHNGIIKGYVSWFPDLKNDQNASFQREFKTFSGRAAGPISLLGWETAQILTSIQEIIKEGATTCINFLDKEGLQTPRGYLQLEPETHQFVGKSWLWELQGNKFEVIQQYTVNQLQNLIEFKITTPVPPQTGWINTYLCS